MQTHGANATECIIIYPILCVARPYCVIHSVCVLDKRTYCLGPYCLINEICR